MRAGRCPKAAVPPGAQTMSTRSWAAPANLKRVRTRVVRPSVRPGIPHLPVLLIEGRMGVSAVTPEAAFMLGLGKEVRRNSIILCRPHLLAYGISHSNSKLWLTTDKASRKVVSSRPLSPAWPQRPMDPGQFGAASAVLRDPAMLGLARERQVCRHE